MTEPRPLTRLERTRLIGLAALIFVILASYAIARPATESLFLGAHGAESLPWAWLMVGMGSLVVVILYNRWSATTDLVRIFGVVSALSAVLLVCILLGLQADAPGMTWALYLWKDLYIVVLIEIFWSFANSTVPEERAKWWYGLFCVLGSLGGMAGNLGVGWMAQATSTEQSLWAVVPLLAVGGFGGFALARWAGVEAQGPKEKPSISDGFSVLKNSRALWLLMALIATTQVAITLVDYQFSIAIEQHFPDADVRTAMIGQVYAAIDLISISLQLATGPILRLLGVPLVLLAIPGILGAAVAGYALIPRYAAIAVAKVASKAFDYSLFRAAKEILYIPLSHPERTQGKAFVDMMSYRMAKGATSLMLLGLVALKRPDLTLWLTLACIGLWVWITMKLNRSR
jgi:AAA family ATP:ADP antiporter